MRILLLAAAALMTILISVPATFDTAEAYYARRGVAVGPGGAARRTTACGPRGCARSTTACGPRGCARRTTGVRRY
jgi:hypothetical protein